MGGLSTSRYEASGPSVAWRRWEGLAAEGFPLQRYLGGTEHSGVFLTVTKGPGGDSKEAAIKLISAGAPAHRDGVTEIVAGRFIGSRQLLLLAPRPSAAHKHVRGSHARSPDHRCIPAHRDGPAKSIARRAIGSSQFLLLGPHSTAAHKHVRGSLVRLRVEGLTPTPDHRRVSAHRYGVAKLVVRRAIESSQFLLLGPCTAAAHQHIRGSLGVVLANSPDHRRIPAHRYGPAELVAHKAIGSGQLLLLGPCGVGSGGQRGE